MSSSTEPDLGFRNLAALNGAAFAGGRMEVAYHLLMAALHAAEDSRDGGQLAAVAAVARGQQRDLDASQPAHRLATRSAHGPRGVFETAAFMAEAVVQRLAMEDRTAELRRHHGGGSGRAEGSSPTE